MNIPPINDHLEYAAQRRLVGALLDGRCFPHPAQTVRLVETHISWVLLAGRYAYKIKKALDLGFLDFTSLHARQFYCAEEIRLNRRLAPKIYLDVIAIGGSPDRPQFGVQPAIEYAVRMRRFATKNQLDALLARGQLTPHHMDQLAATLAAFHGSLSPAPPDSEFGAPATILHAAIQNFEQLLALPLEPGDCDAVNALRRDTEHAYATREKYFALRRDQGFVRECHGDLHLGNIVLLADEPVPFDGIDFNPALRWIDVIDEVAFLVMDLLHSRRADLACRFLNAWLEATGDYAGVAVLHFYLAYRAMVRAKVSAIRACQPGCKLRMQMQALAACRSYLALASACLPKPQPALIITHGLPGSGKSTFAQAALERLQAIRIRSDVERKRLYGMQPLDDSSARADIYTQDATQRTYARLHELAAALLGAGCVVIVDAAFLRQQERDQFRQLAQDMAVPFAIASMQASHATLSARVVQRRSAARDASEADLAVLQALQAAQQPLLPHELVHTVEFLNEAGQHGSADYADAWNKLEKLLAAPAR